MHSAASGHNKRRLGIGRGGSGPLLFLLGAVLLVLIAGGYFFGTRINQKKSAPVTAETHFRENALRSEMATCMRSVEDQRVQKSSLLSGVGDIKREVESLQAKSAQLYSRHEAYEQEAAECTQKAELERKEFDDEAAERARQIKAEREEVEKMRAELDELTNGRGSRLVVDLQALKSMRRLNDALRASLQQELPVGEDTLPTIEAELLTKWGAHLENDALFTENTRRAELSAIVRKWRKWEYDQTVHTDIAPITRGVEGDVARAEWNGHPMKPARGMLDPQAAPALKTGTVSETITNMYDAAMCSYRQNSTRLSYPATFTWMPKLSRASLLEIIDTPILTFCHGCSDPRNSSAFALACGGSDVALHHYGSYAFWSMRSRLRFASAVYNEADRFMSHHGLEEGGFTAVVNHVSESARLKCSRNERINYGPHRLWIEHNFGADAVAHLSDDRDEQCMPSELDLRKVLMKGGLGGLGKNKGKGSDAKSFWGAAMGAGQGGDADDLRNPDAALRVYLSAPDISSERIESDDVRIISREVESPFDEAVDLVIASRAKNIIVSPFFTHSQIVTELFLLEHDLDPQGVTFF